MAKTYIISVNWNGLADTIECLESLLRLDEGDFRVIVVDNGSMDGSIEGLKAWAVKAPSPTPLGPVWQQLPMERSHDASLQIVRRHEIAHSSPTATRITLVAAGENLGFAGANNLGLSFASRDADACYFWLLNNDTVVKSDALCSLVNHATRHPQQGMVGATLLYYDDPDTVQGLGGWSRPSQAKSGHIGAGMSAMALPAEAEVERQLAYVMGASMFVRRTVYEAIGGMSEDYFLYYEELDWASRLGSSLCLGVCLSAVVFHKEGGSIGTSSTRRASDTALYYLFASSLRYYWRHRRRHLPVLVARLFYNIAGFIVRRDVRAINVTLRALLDASSGRLRRGPYGSQEFARLR